MRPSCWTLAAGAIVASLFLFESRWSPVVRVVPDVRVEQSLLETSTRWVSKRKSEVPVPAASVPVQLTRVRVEQSPLETAVSVTGPSSEPSQPAVSVVPCNNLSCATRHASLEPPWAELRFQPNIDWAGGGVRGDCVAGELEYIMPKYCDPAPRDGATGLRQREKPFPSEQRLAEIDVHTAGLPKAHMVDLVRRVGNRTVLFMGDSVMEQFYNALQCFLRKERLEAPITPAFRRWIEETAPLWRLGKRKKPPKLPQAGPGGMRMLYSRVTVMMADEVEAAVATADVIVLNWGLHYQKMGVYAEELRSAFRLLERHAQQPGNVVIFQETGAQHFKKSDARGYSTGEWEHRDVAQDQHCGCQQTEDFNVNSRNAVLADVLGGGGYPHLQVLPFYGLTRPRWRWHFGNCTQRPNGWNYHTCCDCTHFCYSPNMWLAHLHQTEQAISRGDRASGFNSQEQHAL